MLSLLFGLSFVVSGQAGFEPVKLEEFGQYRAMQIQLNGEKRYAVIEPVNFDSYSATEIREEFGSLLQAKFAGLEQDMKVADTFWRSDEVGRTVSDKKISLFMGEEFFVGKIVALDYWQETLQIFEPGKVGDAMKWLKDGSPDEEPTVIRLKLLPTDHEVLVTDQFKYGSYNLSLFPMMITSDMDQRSGQEPSKIGELWDQASGDGAGGYTIYRRGLWRDVTFGGQELPYFPGTWTKVNEAMPGLDGSISVRQLGSRRAFYDASRGELWFTQSSKAEQMCAVLSAEVFRFPVRFVGGSLTVGRMPRFDDSSEDGLCSGGVISAVDDYTAAELTRALLGGGDAQRDLIRDLLLRSRQRVDVTVSCKDGKTRKLYINSLLSYGG